MPQPELDKAEAEQARDVTCKLSKSAEVYLDSRRLVYTA
jgi:hypothetical protein